MAIDAMHVVRIRKLNRAMLQVLTPCAGYVAFRVQHWSEVKHSQVLEACLQINIHCVSVYAFAIDNFKRPPEEVDALMALTEEKLLEISRKGYRSLIFHCLVANVLISNGLQ